MCSVRKVFGEELQIREIELGCSRRNDTAITGRRNRVYGTMFRGCSRPRHLDNRVFLKRTRFSIFKVYVSWVMAVFTTMYKWIITSIRDMTARPSIARSRRAQNGGTTRSSIVSRLSSGRSSSVSHYSRIGGHQISSRVRRHQLIQVTMRCDGSLFTSNKSKDLSLIRPNFVLSSKHSSGFFEQLEIFIGKVFSNVHVTIRNRGTTVIDLISLIAPLKPDYHSLTKWVRGVNVAV